MKASTCCIILTVAAGFLLVPVAGRTESPLPGGKSFPMDKPRPELVGIDGLRARILRGGNDRSANGLDWTQLYSQVAQKLDNAGMKLNSEITRRVQQSRAADIHRSAQARRFAEAGAPHSNIAGKSRVSDGKAQSRLQGGDMANKSGDAGCPGRRAARHGYGRGDRAGRSLYPCL